MHFAHRADDGYKTRLHAVIGYLLMVNSSKVRGRSHFLPMDGSAVCGEWQAIVLLWDHASAELQWRIASMSA